MILAVRVPAGNERGPLYMDHVLSSVHQTDHDRLPLVLTFATLTDKVTLLLSVPPGLRAVVRNQLYAQYPDCHVEEVAEDVLAPGPAARTWTRELTLRPDLFPLKRYPQFEDSLNRELSDPLTAILGAMEGSRKHQLNCRIDLLVRPVSERRAKRCEKVLRSLARIHSHRIARFYARYASSLRWSDRLLSLFLRSCAPKRESADRPLDTSATRGHDREEDLQGASDKLGKHLFEARLLLQVSAAQYLSSEAAEKLSEMMGAFGQYRNRHTTFVPVRRWAIWGRRRRFLLSSEELATLWHPALQTVRAPTLPIVASRELHPPLNLPTPASSPDLSLLGVAAFRGKRTLCGILLEDRRRHMLCLGKTGMGKSTLLHRLLASDIQAGRGVALLDPHGDLCETVLSSIPPKRTGDVILFDAGDTSHALSFNILACDDPGRRHLVASGVIGAFKKLYPEFFGPRMEHHFRNALLTLTEVPGSTLVSVVRLLTDGAYRQEIVRTVNDPIVKNYWQHEFAPLPPKLQAEVLAPILNKVGAFVSSPLLRNVVGQAKNRLNLRAVMDEGKVLLVNLSKGRVGDDASSLLGSLLVTAVQLAAMSRADVTETERRDFSLYVDEFQNYATDSFATILSEARKYRLSLTLANQFLAQIPEATLAAVLGNIGTLISFQVGAQDAELIAAQLGTDVLPADLLTLPAYRAYVRLLVGGSPTKPFTLETLPPSKDKDNPRRPDIIRRTSRQRYGQPIAAVEKAIAAALAGR